MLSISFFCIAVCKKFLPLLSNCSAADGSLSKIAWAALLLRTLRAVAKGLWPFLSLIDKLILGWQRSNEIIWVCWFCIAIWIGVFPSTSRAFTFAPCSIRVWTTCSNPHWQQRWSGEQSSWAISPPAPFLPGLLDAFRSQPLKYIKEY